MRSADVVDITALTAKAIIEHSPSLTVQEKSFLSEDENLCHFSDARLRQMQVTLQNAVLLSLQDHPFYAESLRIL